MSTPVAERDEQEALPAIFEHCLNVYKKMESEAVLYTPPEGTPGPASLIWEGHLTKLFAALHLSVPYYTSVTRELKRMGCIAQKRRGGGNAPSQWIIMTEPTEELFRADGDSTPSAVRRKADRLAVIEQQLRDVIKSQTKIQADYEAILDVLVEKEAQS